MKESIMDVLSKFPDSNLTSIACRETIASEIEIAVRKEFEKERETDGIEV